jgi:hypothetical protein
MEKFILELKNNYIFRYDIFLYIIRDEQRL